MKEHRNNIQGFWLGYVDALAVMLTVFLILFVVVSQENAPLKKENQQLKKDMDSLVQVVTKLKQEDAGKELKEFKVAINQLRDKLTEKGIETAVDKRLGGYQIVLDEQVISFPQMSCELSYYNQQKLKDVAVILKEFFDSQTIQKSCRLVIGGHTDASGLTAKSNLQEFVDRGLTSISSIDENIIFLINNINIQLSSRRANSVNDIIQPVLQNTILIETVGYAYNYPRDTDGSTLDPRNRRVTITIQPIALEYLQ